jgi:DNA adenine methylase
MPKHRIYAEPFGGAASVLMRKPRSYAEVYNDRDGEVVSLFRILQDRAAAEELERRLRLTPFARDEFDDAYGAPKDEIDRARYLIIRAFMGFGSDGHNPESGKTGFRANSNRSGTTPAHDWVNYPKCIRQFCERLEGVVIENRDAAEIMAQQDSQETLFFLDPPYVHDTRGAKHSYRFEMTNEAHETLVEFIQGLRGMVMLCGYENDIYSRMGWKCLRRKTFADGARERTECLWFNNAAESGIAQAELFPEAARP